MSESHQPLVSVIVPVYNVEAFLEKCLRSISEQTFRDIEVIIVDDGSTDGSREIAEKYAMTDPRFKVLSKMNGGLSSARNYGIEKASGVYLTFIDSDDYIDSDMIEVLYQNMEREHADISMCTLYDVYPNIIIKQNDDIKYMVVDSEEAIRIVFEAKLTSVFAVAKLYKKELFNKVKYPVGRIAEDAFVIVDLLDQCDRIVIQTIRKYYYIHRQGSITTSEFSRKNWDVVDAYQKNYDYICKRYPKLHDVAQMRVCWAHFFVLDKLATSSKKDAEIENRTVKYLRKHFLFIMKDQCFTKSRKAAMCALMLSKVLYKMIAKGFIQKRGVNP